MNTTNAAARAIPLNGMVRHALQQYFQDLNGHEPNDLYQLLLAEVERQSRHPAQETQAVRFG